jgi:hypothetical protein
VRTRAYAREAADPAAPASLPSEDATSGQPAAGFRDFCSMTAVYEDRGAITPTEQ